MAKKAALALLLTVAVVATAQIDAIWDQIASQLSGVLGMAPVTADRLERVEPTENADHWAIARLMFEIQMFQYEKSKEADPQNTIAVRDAHAKGHGCVRADFTVENVVPDWARAGIFNESGRSYSSLIRFSNGTGQMRVPDSEKDARGMAIKLVDEEKLETNLLGTGRTQDFLLINNDRFFIRNTRDYLKFQQTLRNNKGDIKDFIVERAIKEALGEDVTDEKIAALIPPINALQEGDLTAVATISAEVGLVNAGKLGRKLWEVKEGKAPLELTIAGGLQTVIESGLTQPYFSMASYKLKDTAVKYLTQPVACENATALPVDAASGDNFLAGDLINRVAADDYCFDFLLQPLPAVDLEAQRTLVEDSRLRFETAPVRVAKIRIYAQDISAPKKAEYCENLRFNPWHAQPGHTPLGSMNRARRFAVTASAIRRHLLNRVKQSEPRSVLEY